jgi:hypothetical protein
MTPRCRVVYARLQRAPEVWDTFCAAAETESGTDVVAAFETARAGGTGDADFERHPVAGGKAGY